MSLKPMNNTVFGEIVEGKRNEALDEELRLATKDFEQSLSTANGRGLQTALKRANRVMEAQLEPEPKLFQIKVIATGPDCIELEKGDIAILKARVGSMITVVNVKTREPRRVFCVSEDDVLARFRA